eukprot:TRINITY_DN978_c0_g2_i15.p2 TRINITY_DN978_c0_g2~~TRINITY_DN978_c0_g2_i15.p2  ORF type:complete len:572 (-),score=58.59 TRINITY_DN978_c0_g2_i15:4171-5691(-)
MYVSFRCACVIMIGPVTVFVVLAAFICKVSGQTATAITTANVSTSSTSLASVFPPPVTTDYCFSVCNEYPPPPAQGDIQYTCAQQKEWGKCDADFMVGYCECTCDRCCACNDSPPPGSEYTCKQQKEFGKCDQDFMQGYCECECQRCAAEETASFDFGGPMTEFEWDMEMGFYNEANLSSMDRAIYYMRNMDSIARKAMVSDTLRTQLLHNQQAYVALCLIARDEHPFIREWINYHNYIGVEKFYIYDHLSLPPMEPLLEEYIVSGLVDYTYLSLQWLEDDYNLDARPQYYNGTVQKNSPQRWAHLDCLLQHKHKHKFMAMVDIDEFIVLNQGSEKGYLPVEAPNLPQYLSQFEATGGVYMQWRHFGSSGHMSRPSGLVLESYLQCEEKHDSVTKSLKTIKHMVNTKYMQDLCIVHTCYTSVPSVNTEFVPASPKSHVPETWEGLALNHYIYKSQQDFAVKQMRGGGHMNTDRYRNLRTWSDFQKVDSRTKGDCSYMVELANACCK